MTQTIMTIEECCLHVLVIHVENWRRVRHYNIVSSISLRTVNFGMKITM